MGIIRFKPISPGRRFFDTMDYNEITTSRPHKPLTKGKKSTGGRNNNGEISMWWGFAGVHQCAIFIRPDK